MELLNARWDLDSGRTVEFRIVEQPGEDRVNPFKKCQKRRGGRVGQIFRSVVVTTDTQSITYDSEFMLCGWGESSNKGQWVSFWLDEDASLHPFAGFRRRSGDGLGRFFMVVLSVIDDEGRPTDIVVEQGIIRSNTPTAKRIIRRLSQDAHVIVTGDLFIQWLKEKIHTEKEWTPELSKKWAREKIGVESLSEIDTDKDKANKFHTLIRLPFSEWAGNNKRE